MPAHTRYAAKASLTGSIVTGHPNPHNAGIGRQRIPRGWNGTIGTASGKASDVLVTHADGTQEIKPVSDFAKTRTNHATPPVHDRPTYTTFSNDEVDAINRADDLKRHYSANVNSAVATNSESWQTDNS